jgi:hypothetical protein
MEIDVKYIEKLKTDFQSMAEDVIKNLDAADDVSKMFGMNRALFIMNNLSFQHSVNRLGILLGIHMTRQAADHVAADAIKSWNEGIHPLFDDPNPKHRYPMERLEGMLDELIEDIESKIEVTVKEKLNG